MPKLLGKLKFFVGVTEAAPQRAMSIITSTRIVRPDKGVEGCAAAWKKNKSGRGACPRCHIKRESGGKAPLPDLFFSRLAPALAKLFGAEAADAIESEGEDQAVFFS